MAYQPDETNEDLAELGAYYVEAGARKFAEWSNRFLGEFSENDRKLIEPRLQELYDLSVKVAKESSTAASVIRKTMKERGRKLKATPRRALSAPESPEAIQPSTIPKEPLEPKYEPGKPMTKVSVATKKSLAAWRLVLIVAALVVIAMALFPPWCIYSPCRPAGYAFISRPPVGARMDTARLTIQILAAVVVAGLLALAFRPASNRH